MQACDHARPPLSVVVIGGGPVGLIFACSLAREMRGACRIDVYDRRWDGDGGAVAWARGMARRQQVVTVQSREYSTLAPDLVDAVFTHEAGEIWPLGPGSVRGLHPRNVRIAHLEDALLAYAHTQPAITLHAGEADVRALLGRTPLVVIADGANSSTRERFAECFGAPDASAFALGGVPLVDTCLGLRVRSPLSDGASVVLTAAQRRLLLNPLGGDGYVNVRLSGLEVDALGAAFGPPSPRGYEQQWIVPEKLAATSLWARLDEELALFGLRMRDVQSCSAFRLDMVTRPRFVAPLFEPDAHAAQAGIWRTYGCLLGDAANAIHFWPGRGINAGILSAVSLARCVSRHWPAAAVRPGGFRDAEFMRHEGVLQMLQYRHKSRAWRSMVAPGPNGTMVPIRDILSRADAVDAETGASDREIFHSTVRDVFERLAPRLPRPPAAAELERVVDGLGSRALRAFVASGPWDGQPMGGEEVDLEWLLPEHAELAVCRG